MKMNNKTTLPLLVVDEEEKKELSNLTSELCRGHLDTNIMPYLAENVDDALDVYSEHKGSLGLAILTPGSQETHDSLTLAGYRGRFLVYGKKDELKQSWEDREVGFLDPDSTTERAAEIISGILPYDLL